MKQERKQEGYWISIGSGFGIMLGLLIGIPFDNSAIGLIIGAVIGLIVGAFILLGMMRDLRKGDHDEWSGWED